jgi:hypothetical protein
LQLQHVIDGKVTDAPIKVAFNAQARMGGPAPDLMETPTLYVPLTLTKTEGSMANTDSLLFKLQSADGRVLYNDPAGIAENRGHDSLTTVARDPSALSSKATYAGVALPYEDYAKFKGQAVRASFTYYFTAYQASAPIQAVVRPRHRQIIDHVGICEARRNAQNPAYTDLYCFAAADEPPCLGSAVRYTDTGKVVPLKVRCPYPSHFSDIGIMAPGHLVAAYPTPAGNAAVQVILTPYRLRNHFTQTVVVPSTRLEYLTPPSSGGQ